MPRVRGYQHPKRKPLRKAALPGQLPLPLPLTREEMEQQKEG